MRSANGDFLRGILTSSFVMSVQHRSRLTRTRPWTCGEGQSRQRLCIERSIVQQPSLRMILIHVALPIVLEATLVTTTVVATRLVWYDIGGKGRVSDVQAADDGCSLGDGVT